MKKNQKGFGVVEVLMVIVIVGLIGALGWLVYDRQKSKSNEKVTTVQKIQQEQKQEAPKNEEVKQPAYFEIKEMGVKFVLPDNLKGLYYALSSDNTTAYFSLNEFKDTECAADKTAQVALTRYTDVDFQNSSMVPKEKAKKVGGYHFASIGGQAACSEDEALQKKASQLRADIVKILPGELVAQ